MNWDDGLEGNALTIAASDARFLRVPAGPGTGKSYALKRRVARLLQEGQDPERILVVTFTRTAAKNLVEDLMDIGVTGSNTVLAGTLHSFCFSLLRNRNVFNSLHRIARPLLTFSISKSLQFEAKAMLDDILYSTGTTSKRECTKQIRAFEAAWARTQEIHPGHPITIDDTTLQHQLVSWLVFHRSILVGELIPLTLRYLTDNPVEPRDSWFDHVIVDEYQDLNRAEQAIIDILAEHGKTLVVGDSDQSIFSFRYANPEGMDDFGVRHTETINVGLNDCHRCPTRVVKIANKLISNNHIADLSPTINPVAGNPQGSISILKWTSIQQEVQGITNYVQHLIDNRAIAPKDILVICPRREIGYSLRDALQSSAIGVESHFNEQPVYTDEAQRALALFILHCDNQDRLALRYWLGRGSSNSRRGSYSKLRNWCETNNLSPWDTLSRVLNGTTTVRGINALLDPFRELLNELNWARDRDLAQIIDKYLPDENDDVSLLREVALEVLEDTTDPLEFVNSLRANIAYPERGEGDRVRIMSAQKSKGLTSDVVIVMSCNQGIIPRFPDPDDEEEPLSSLEEQRRLFYVAITRCKKTLVISSVDVIDRGFARRNEIEIPDQGPWFEEMSASQFIGELGASAPNTVRGSVWEQRGYR